LVESFGDEESARKALDRIVDAEPEAAEHVALFVHGEDGCRSVTRSSLAPPSQAQVFAEVRSTVNCAHWPPEAPSTRANHTGGSADRQHCRQLVEHKERLGARPAQRRLVAVGRIPKGAHPGRDGGGDPGWRVLHDRAARGLDPHRGGGVQEEVRVRLAARNRMSGEQNLVGKRASSPVNLSDSRVFSSFPWEATHTGTLAALMRFTVSAAPGTARSSRRKAAARSRSYRSSQPSASGRPSLARARESISASSRPW
jgi:hypothetical protein